VIDALAQVRVADSIVRLLVLLLVLVALPHATNLSAWLFVFLIFTVSWRLAAIVYPRLMPGRWALGLALVIGILNVGLNVDLFDGRLVGTALLVVMLGLKLLELKNRRDVYVCVYLGFFLALTQFLFHQSLWLAIYLFALSGMLGALLVMLNRVKLEVRQTLTTSTMLMVSAVPAALALFLVFPRLDHPLWAIHVDQSAGITGISDQMQMGTVGELSQSSNIAFRARFIGEAPPANKHYWRGLVLWHYDGKTWTPESNASRPQRLLVNEASLLGYEITLEPTQQPWVFALDMPGGVPQPLRLNEELRVIAPSPITERTTYQLSAYTDYQATGLSPRQREMGLTVPVQVSQRTRQLAAGWRRQHGDNAVAIVQSALDYFTQNPFVYTLSPGTLHDNPVDQFLFETRRGFCEHYAGSFAVLMRLAGVPARIVLGYQGGEYNPRADHWLIRQSNAHAWNEVWLGEAGWVRVDPTAAVAPERIERSIDAAQSRDQDQVVFRVGNDGLISDLFQEASWLIDAVEIGWHRWVLGFSQERQTSLLQNLGFEDLAGYEYGLAVVAVLGLGMSFAYVISILRQRPQTDQTLQLWQKLLARMQRKGLDIPAWFGPKQVLVAASERWPDQRVALQKIVRLYIHLRYGRAQRSRQEKKLQRAIQRLKLN